LQRAGAGECVRVGAVRSPLSYRRSREDGGVSTYGVSLEGVDSDDGG
jgi:hypothetical protein